MEVREFDFDPLSGIRERYWYDHATDQFTMTTEQDVQPIIEQNRLNQDLAPARYGNEQTFHHIASIPFALMPILEKMGIMDKAGRILDDKALRRWLNDADNRAFRSRLGRV